MISNGGREGYAPCVVVAARGRYFQQIFSPYGQGRLVRSPYRQYQRGRLGDFTPASFECVEMAVHVSSSWNTEPS